MSSTGKQKLDLVFLRTPGVLNSSEYLVLHIHSAASSGNLFFGDDTGYTNVYCAPVDAEVAQAFVDAHNLLATSPLVQALK